MKNDHFVKRLGFAINGIRVALNNEPSFRFQLLAALGAYLTLAVFRAPALWWALFSITVAGVLTAELFNTALENLIDHLHPEVHPSIKVVKDCAAGAVLIFSFCALIVLVAFFLDGFYQHI